MKKNDIAIKIQQGFTIGHTFKSHGGSVPLSTVVHCYEAEAKAAQDEDKKDDAKICDIDFSLGLDDAEEGGVPMEHLISCIKGLRVKATVAKFVKKISFHLIALVFFPRSNMA